MHKFKVGDKVDHFGHIGTITKADITIPWDNNKLGAEVTWDNTSLIPPTMTCSYDSLIYVGPGSNYVKSFGGGYKSVEDRCPVCDTPWTETSFNGKTFYDCIPCGMKKEDLVAQYSEYQEKTNLPVGKQNEVRGLNGSISLGGGGTQSQDTNSIPFDPFGLGLDDSDIGDYDDSIDFKVQGLDAQIRGAKKSVDKGSIFTDEEFDSSLKAMISESDDHFYKNLSPGRYDISIEGHIMAAPPVEPNIVEIKEPIDLTPEVGDLVKLTDTKGNVFHAYVMEKESVQPFEKNVAKFHWVPLEANEKNMDSMQDCSKSIVQKYRDWMDELWGDDETHG